MITVYLKGNYDFFYVAFLSPRLNNPRLYTCLAFMDNLPVLCDPWKPITEQHRNYANHLSSKRELGHMAQTNNGDPINKHIPSIYTSIIDNNHLCLVEEPCFRWWNCLSLGWGSINRIRVNYTDFAPLTAFVSVLLFSLSCSHHFIALQVLSNHWFQWYHIVYHT